MGDPLLECQALMNMGHNYRYYHRSLARAVHFYEQALNIARRINVTKVEGKVLGRLGGVYQDFGKPHEAIKVYEEQHALARSISLAKKKGRGSRSRALADDFMMLRE